MKTIDSIIDKEIRARVSEDALCEELVLSASQDPEGYDSIIEAAAETAEQMIKNNFALILGYAAGKPAEEEPETEETGEISLGVVAEEDREMLDFIMS